MKSLKYALRQRLVVPGQVETIGVVKARTEVVNAEPGYQLCWHSTSGNEQTGWFTEAELLAANGGPPQAANFQVAPAKKSAAKRSPRKR